MDQLKTLMIGSRSQDVTDVDANELLAELSADDSNHDANLTSGVSHDDPPVADPTAGAPPAVGEQESRPHIHTIPLELSAQNTDLDEQSPLYRRHPLASDLAGRLRPN